MSKKNQEYASQIIAVMARNDYTPLRSKELAAVINVSKRDYSRFRETLTELEEQGEIKRSDGVRWEKKPGGNIFIGEIDIALSGHGFFLPDDPEEPDVFIPPENLGYAFDGDKVKVKVINGSGRDRRPYGKVVEVLARARSRIVAVLLESGKARPEDPRNPFDFSLIFTDEVLIKSASQAAKSLRRRKQAEKTGETAKKTTRINIDGKPVPLPPVNSKLLLEITVWPDSDNAGEARVIEILGPAGDPDTETAAILAAQEAPGAFPDKVLLETRKLPRELSVRDSSVRLDLTKEIVCTIDPADARDFDDALSIKMKDDGSCVVGVHIADVSHYVVPDSELDQEARERSTSIYLPERVIPMLPEELSNDICSLRPGEIRPVKTVFLHFDASGKRTNYSIHRSFIKSHYRFAYEQVRDLLSDDKLAREFPDKELMTSLRGLHDIATKLRNNRLENGSIELNLPEYRVMIDENGHAAEMIRIENDFSHHLVEEFMLAANQAVAEWSAANGLPVLHRVHAPPADDKVENLSEFLNASGYPFKPPLKRKKLMAVIGKARGRPEEHAINLMILKSFQQAVYAPDPDTGHFALNFTKYQHFTSPIRRYPDLHLHQMLDKAFGETGDKLPKRLRKAITDGRKELESLGMHTSGRERRAMLIEEEVKKFRRLELLSLNPQREFVAVVTGIKKFGVFVEIEDFFVEGMLPRMMLEKKGFAAREELPDNSGKKKGKSGFARHQPVSKGFSLGQEVKIRIKNINLAARICEMEFIDVI